MKKLLVSLAAVSGLAVLGYLGWKMFGNKNVNNRRTTPATSEKKDDETIVPEVKTKPKKETVTKQKNVKKEKTYKQKKNSFTTPDELVKLVCLDILKDPIKGPEDFLEKLIRGCGNNIDNYEWYQSFPKNIEELEIKLKEFELYEQYTKKLEENYKK